MDLVLLTYRFCSTEKYHYGYCSTQEIEKYFNFLLKLILFYCLSQKLVSAGFCSTQYWILFYCEKQSTGKYGELYRLVKETKYFSTFGEKLNLILEIKT